MKDFCVYIVHNIVNNKVYVGKTNDPKKRWRKHVEAAMSDREDHKFYIHRAIKKYGADNFIFTSIQEFGTEREQDLAEKYWIRYFNSRNNKFGYNLTDGGEGCVGRIVSQPTKDKISSSLTGHVVLRSTRDKIISKLINIEKPQVFKNKISKARTGTVHAPSTKIKLSAAKLGELNPNSKLDVKKAKEIRRLSILGFTTKQLSEMFGVSKRTILNVVSYQSWKME